VCAKMNRTIITGLNGTLAPHLAATIEKHGGEVLPWDRQAIDPDNTEHAWQWLSSQQPKAIAHLAMGSPSWAAFLARFCAVNSIPFIFTSTAMVFDCLPDGPHQVTDALTAKDDYGKYKIACEEAIFAVNANAMVMRIGWQIDENSTGNNMLHALDNWQADQGEVAASVLWVPACSFMADTANALQQLIASPVAGIHHFDSNAVEAHNFFTLAQALAKQFGRSTWKIREKADYAHDQRLVSQGIQAPALSKRLLSLGE
jgi:dTDP-4-dehydrorhamnose reductase